MSPSTLLDTPSLPTYYCTEDQPGDFETKFERACFLFSHAFANSPLFSEAGILELAKSQPECAYYDIGEIEVDQRWDQLPPRPVSLEQAINNVGNTGAWVFVNNAQRHPEYARIVDDCLRQAEDLAKRKLRRNMRNQEMIIFLTSPNRVTPYHIDRECNFLLQIRGEKIIHTFDGNDRSILTEQELERFWAVDNNAARYREANQSKARSFLLRPGKAVHLPVNFPHWVKNADNISISVSINFQFDDRVRADLYRANYFLRRHGITPAIIGRSPWRDRLKSEIYHSGREVYRRFFAK